MDGFLRQGTSATVPIGPFLDDSDGKTIEDGLTISQADVRLKKNGGDAAQKNDSNACVHDELGVYNCQLDTTDTGTVGRLSLFVHESGALPVWHHFQIIPQAVYDSLVAGTDYLQVDALQVEGSDATDQINAACDAALADYDAVVPADLPANFADLAIAVTTGRVDVGLVEGGDATDAINAACDAALADYDAPTKAELDSAFTEIKGATWDSGTDTLEAIRNKETDIETDTQDIQTGVDTIEAKLPSKSYLAGTANADGDVQMDEATGNFPGSVGSVAGAVASVSGNVGGNVTGSIGSLGAQAKLDVNAEADTALTDYDPPTKAELDSGLAGLNDIAAADVWDATSATLSLSFETIIDRLYRFMMNKMLITDATGAVALRNEVDSGDIATQTITDDDTTTTRTALSWS